MPESVETQLAVINTKLDLLLVQRDDHEARIRSLEEVAQTSEEQARQASRIAKLEQFRYTLVGVALASGGVWSAIVQGVK